MFPHLGFCAVFALLCSTSLAAKNPKRGLAFAEGDNPNDIKQANQSSSVISWQYNWATSPPDYLAKSGITFHPMQWGPSGIQNFAATAKAQGAKLILVGYPPHQHSAYSEPPSRLSMSQTLPTSPT